MRYWSFSLSILLVNKTVIVLLRCIPDKTLQNAWMIWEKYELHIYVQRRHMLNRYSKISSLSHTKITTFPPQPIPLVKINTWHLLNISQSTPQPHNQYHNRNITSISRDTHIFYDFNQLQLVQNSTPTLTLIKLSVFRVKLTAVMSWLCRALLSSKWNSEKWILIVTWHLPYYTKELTP